MNLRTIALGAFALLAVASCQKEDAPFPSIITEMADAYTNEQGTIYIIETDARQRYMLSNPMMGYEPKVLYRTLCSYLPDADGKQATVYGMSGVWLLGDSTQTAVFDPTPVLSAWKAGKYINIHLAPKTQGGKQYWGYCLAQSESGAAHIRLHHKQGNDPQSYTTDVYASIPLDSLKQVVPGDSIILTIDTPSGVMRWDFVR